MYLSSDESSAVIPIPHYPGLALLCTAPERYSLILMRQIVCRIARSISEEEVGANEISYAIEVNQMKELLHHIHEPHQLAKHPLAACCVQIAPEQRGLALTQFLADAIATLEYPVAQANRQLPGTILRMRYIERYRTKQTISLLHLSERHYYRLHLSGLQWLASQFEQYVRQGGW